MNVSMNHVRRARDTASLLCLLCACGPRYASYNDTTVDNELFAAVVIEQYERHFGKELSGQARGMLINTPIYIPQDCRVFERACNAGPIYQPTVYDENGFTVSGGSGLAACYSWAKSWKHERPILLAKTQTCKSKRHAIIHEFMHAVLWAESDRDWPSGDDPDHETPGIWAKPSEGSYGLLTRVEDAYLELTGGEDCPPSGSPEALAHGTCDNYTDPLPPMTWPELADAAQQ